MSMLQSVMSSEWKVVVDAADIDGKHDLLALPLDTHVGRECAKLLALVNQIESMGCESDIIRTIREQAVEQMAVWLFG